jgi:hypothetical protein
MGVTGKTPKVEHITSEEEFVGINVASFHWIFKRSLEKMVTSPTPLARFNFKMNTITQGTLIPLGLAVAVIGGAAVWVTETRAQIRHNTIAIEEVRRLQAEYVKQLYEINSRLSRMEWKLEKVAK